MSPLARPGRRLPIAVALVVGSLAGAGLLLLDDLRTGPIPPASVRIGVNGLPPVLSRDLWLPVQGFTLQLDFEPPLATTGGPDAGFPALEVELREERTGRTLAIQDRFVAHGDGLTFHVDEDLGLREGLLAVRARAVFADGSASEDWRRLRIRGAFGGPPIGQQQIVHFDFTVDRDGDARPDFEADLERLGLAPADDSPLARAIAQRIARRTLARVEESFADPRDPNRTGAASDPVAIRFTLEPTTTLIEQPHTTRICVGGSDPEHPGSLGHVRFDPRNGRRASVECEGDGDDPRRAGLFPGELAIYRESALFREVFAPFGAELGGDPIGSRPGDARLLEGDSAAAAASAPRRAQLERAIAVLGDVLGTLLAHETGHALGLVAPGKPPYGLFGGDAGEDENHAIDPNEVGASALSLMQPGGRFRFEELAGQSAGGPLRFRPIDYAYLRDRLVLRDDRHTSL